MARRTAFGGFADLCSHKPRFVGGRKRIYPDQDRRSFPETRAVAKRALETTPARGGACLRGGIMKQRILVVEDHSANRELMRDWLESENFEVYTAENLEQAYAELRTKTPHAVLLDIKLGAEDGLTLAGWIRRDPKLQRIPIIAVTAHAMVSDHERVVQAGCNACISKPVE